MGDANVILTGWGSYCFKTQEALSYSNCYNAIKKPEWIIPLRPFVCRGNSNTIKV